MSADLMRRYLAIVEGSSNEIDSLFQSTVLVEGRVLTEGAVADRIKAAMAKVSQKFGRATPQVLDQVANRADSLFQRDEQVSWVIDRAKALGRSPALLAAMIGICGALISLAPNPAAAQDAAGKLQPILSAQDVNQIVDLLAQHGISIKTETGTNTTALPSGLSAPQIKAAKALKAIADFVFEKGSNIESERSFKNSIAIEGGVKKEGAEFSETVSLWSPDHGLLLAEYTTGFKVENGFPTLVEDSSVGLRVELTSVFEGLSEPTQVAVNNYINQSSDGLSEGAALTSIEAMLKAKGPHICLYVASLMVRQGRVAAKIRISPKGIQVAGNVAG